MHYDNNHTRQIYPVSFDFLTSTELTLLQIQRVKQF